MRVAGYERYTTIGGGDGRNGHITGIDWGYIHGQMVEKEIPGFG